ncbi:MAG: aminoglycoside phosphotransferase family protein [Lachnospiraceae bacterium]|nr:aminoglycoside phosphotransferase family protein [Lachnospiraceae bacterium]
MKNEEPEKWRNTIDPFSLPLKKVCIQEILGYPHAANQVFYVKGVQAGKEGYYYLKYAHHVDANLKNEIEILWQLHFRCTPEVVEYDAEDYQYEVTRQIDGRRLSVILEEAGLDSGLSYMYEYGRTLARLHQAAGSFPKAPHRRFHDIPEPSHFEKIDMEDVREWLIVNKPTQINTCFVHGDFHYANLLWKDGYISGILDFELAGMGNREFDVAWALILRPGQKFMRTEEELWEFIAGYTAVGGCDPALVRYYMALIYTRFIKFGDEQYAQFVRKWVRKCITQQ